MKNSSKTWQGEGERACSTASGPSYHGGRWALDTRGGQPQNLFAHMAQPHMAVRSAPLESGSGLSLTQSLPPITASSPPDLPRSGWHLCAGYRRLRVFSCESPSRASLSAFLNDTCQTNRTLPTAPAVQIHYVAPCLNSVKLGEPSFLGDKRPPFHFQARNA